MVMFHCFRNVRVNICLSASAGSGFQLRKHGDLFVVLTSLSFSYSLPGWYVVWHLFLSKFKFLRELVGDAGTPQTEKPPSDIRSEHTSQGLSRSRPRSARQRVAFPDSPS